MPKLLLAVIVVMLAAGCGSKEPNYFYSPQGSDPALVFQSEIELHTDFSVNIDPAGGNVCKDYKYTGFTLLKDSIFVFGKPNKEIRINVPAGQPVSVQANHSFSDGQYSSYCGPVGRTFIPEKGKTYLVTMRKREVGSKMMCGLTVADATQPSIPVKSTAFTACNRK